MGTRRNLYRAASFLGDVQAIRKGPAAVVKRQARKSVYRRQGRWTRAILKGLGL